MCEDSIQFGEVVAYKRKQMKLSLKELSDLSGVSVSYISKIENGKSNNINYKTVKQLSYVLNIPENFLNEVFELKKEKDIDLLMSDFGLSEEMNTLRENSKNNKEILLDRNILYTIKKMNDTGNFGIKNIISILEQISKLEQLKKSLYMVASLVDTNYLRILITPTIATEVLDAFYLIPGNKQENTFICEGRLLKIADRNDLFVEIIKLDELIEKVLEFPEIDLDNHIVEKAKKVIENVLNQ